MKKFYSINAKHGKKAEILLYDEIGAGFFGGVGAESFVKELSALKVNDINLRINSPGGSVIEGMAIYNALIRHDARITVDIDGLAASISSIIAMAGDEINIAENALMMIHNPWMMAVGDSEALRGKADILDKIRSSIVDIYTNRSSVEENEVSDMMHAETWLSADESVAAGLVDNVTESLQMAAKFDLSRFNNAPEALKTLKANDKPDNIRVGIARRRMESRTLLKS